MAWSTDGTGLAISVSDADSAFEGPRGPRVPKSSSLRLLDVATGALRAVGTISGAWLVPLSWNRADQFATAAEYGRDGPSTPSRSIYLLDEQRGSTLALAQLPAAMEPFTLRMDSAGRVALGLESRPCGQFRCMTLWTWSVPDPAHAESHGPTDRSVRSAAFRPGSNRIFTVVNDAPTATAPPANPSIEDWGPLGAARPRVLGTQPRGHFFFRSDGSAIVIGSIDMNDRRGTLLDPDSGAAVAFPLQDDVIASLAPRAASVAPTAPRAAVQFVAWPDGAQAGWVSPDAQFVAARLADGVGLYRVVRATTSLTLQPVTRLSVGGFGGGRWLEDSSGFIFESDPAGRHTPDPTALELVILERSGALTRLASGVPHNASTFSRLALDGRSIAIASLCCPERAQIVPRDGGTPRDTGEGAPTAWDDRDRLLLYKGRDIIANASSKAPGYRVTVPPVPNEPEFTVFVQSASPDHKAFLVEASRVSGPQSLRILVDGQLLAPPDAGLPIGRWISAHELLLHRSSDGQLSALDALTKTVRTLPTVIPAGATWWETNGNYLAWGARGMNITDVESGVTRAIDLPSSDALVALGVTAPSTFVIMTVEGLRFVEARSLLSRPSNVTKGITTSARTAGDAAVDARLGSLSQFAAARDSAIQKVRANPEVARRIDRIQVKLVTWGDFQKTQEFVDKQRDPSSPVWIVAVVGDIKPELADGRPFGWTLFILDPSGSQYLGSVNGTGTTWPDYFSALKDLSVP